MKKATAENKDVGEEEGDEYDDVYASYPSRRVDEPSSLAYERGHDADGGDGCGGVGGSRRGGGGSVAAAARPPPRNNVAASITNIAARLFWLKHFGKHVGSVPWDEFAGAFEREYGEQVPTRYCRRRAVCARGGFVRRWVASRRHAAPRGIYV